MVTTRRAVRWGLYGAGGLLALVVVFRVAIGIYLSTASGKATVARQIGKQIGMPVEVTEVRLGLLTSSIGMRVFDPAAPEPTQSEVLGVGKASADVSIFGLATGSVEPDWVTLDGVTLTLHVAADGKVITTLPHLSGGGGGGGHLPSIKVTGGRLTIKQEGRPEFALQNLGLSVTAAGDAVKLAGAIDDPAWSKWTVTGEINAGAKTGWVELSTPDGPLTMDRLGSVPFVPPSVWQSVQPNGRGAVAVKVWASPGGSVEYSVDIKPAAAALTLPDASVTLTRVTGLIRVTGAKVTLQDAKAEVAGGSLALDGDLDFGADPTTVALTVAASGLDIKQLPPEWGLNKDFEGKLKGTATISLKIFPDGRIDPEGSGEGLLTGVKVLGFDSDDIPIRLRKTGKKLQLQQQKEKADAGRGDRGLVRTLVRCAAPRAAQEKKPADPPAKTDAPKKDDDGPTMLDATIRLRDVDVSQLLEKLDIKLGYKIGGKMTVVASVAVPVASAANTGAYQFAGEVTSPALTFEGLTVRDVAAKMVYTNGKLSLTNLSGKIDQPGKSGLAPGSFKGSATMAVNPAGDATANLTIDNIPLEQIARALPGVDLAITGTVSGKVDLKSQYEKLWDPTVWSGTAVLTSSEIVAEGRSIKDIKFSAALAKGVLTMTEARLTLEGIPVTGEATLGVSDTYPFTAVVRTTGTEVTDLRKLVPEAGFKAAVEGVLETESKVTGTLSPLSFAASGTVTATKLTLGRSSANHIAAKWALTEDRVALTDLKADVFGGTITGSADVPFAADKAGKFEVNFKEVDVGVASELIPDVPVRVTGKVTGKVSGTIPPAKAGESRVGNIDLDITAPKLTVQGIPAERLVGKAALKGKVLEYELEGKTLGGSFELKGRYPGQKKDKLPAGANDRGSLKVTGIDLSRIATDVGFQSLSPLRGRIDANFDFDNDLSTGSGRVAITGVRWGNASIAREVTGVLVMRDGVVDLSDFAGRVAGGELRARARVYVSDPRRNFFSVALTRVDAKQVLALVGADAADLIDGPMTLTARGRLGGETRISGSLSLPRGSVSGVAVTDLVVPFEVSTAPGGYGRLSVQNAVVNAGNGRVQPTVTVDWGHGGMRVDGQIRFINVPISAVVPQLGENALIGNGRITGRFDLGGQNVRSVADLTGNLVAVLNNTSVREIPILRQATPFLNPAGLVKPFQSGDVRGSLSKGVFRIDRLALANPTAQVFAEGTITTTGRVDLDVVAHTGTIGPSTRGLRLFGLRLPMIGPVPVGLIRDVSDFLSNRTIRLTVTGTTSNPIVKVNVGALLREEAVRFFLSRYVVPSAAADVLGLGGLGALGAMDDK
jgi:translocation and assembly module TamB